MNTTADQYPAYSIQQPFVHHRRSALSPFPALAHGIQPQHQFTASASRHTAAAAAATATGKRVVTEALLPPTFITPAYLLTYAQ